MPIITSPVKRYPGTVTLPDYYLFGDVIQWREKFDAAAELEPKEGETLTTAVQLRIIQLQGAAIIPMVTEWHLQGIPEHPSELPATPIASAVRLIGWLVREVSRLMNEGEEIDPLPEGESSAG